MKIRITPLDGKLPNLALMKLAHFHRARGDEIFFERSARRGLFEPEYDRVYGSAIFSRTAGRVADFKREFPTAIVGGTWNEDFSLTVESVIDRPTYEFYDYEIYPRFTASIGFTQRGCRLNCNFCAVGRKEGKVVSVNSIEDIYRGAGHPKHLLLLDNDFFGQTKWREKSERIIDGDFKVSFSQGINIRLIKGTGLTDIGLIGKSAAEMLAKMKYYDDDFKTKRIYTAWDNARDEKRFLEGINLLLGVGIKPREILVYFLCNYWTKGLTDDVWHRFNKMVEIGILPFPMVYDRDNAAPELLAFQRFVIRGVYRSTKTDFETFLRENKRQYFARIANEGSKLLWQ